MKTRKIIADTMPLALKKVRQELGENAIIVNTRVIKSGGLLGLFTKQKYEVTAYSIDKNQSEEKEVLPKTEPPKKDPVEVNREEQEPLNSGFHKKPQNLYQFYSQQPSKPEAIIPPTPAVESTKHDTTMLDELTSLRKMMMTFMMGENQGNVRPAALSKIVEHLKKQGVEETVVEHIVSTIMKKYDSLNELTEATIKTEILTIIIDLIIKRVPKTFAISDQTRIINVIGPTGVGKTTSIAKLATEQVLKQKRKVAMITTDVYRIGAVEQLKTYAGILNVPIEVVRSGDELASTLDKLKNYDLIYMDTTGRNYKEEKNRESIKEFLFHPPESDNYLAISLTTKYEDLRVLLDEFSKSPVQKLIFTKADETSSYGTVLNIAYQYSYQLAYITTGQSVPEDIITVDAESLAKNLVGEEN
ncbi:flagellar biosynthesis protein FlhF [Neobacillus sp. LXY-1]|uniref:flagellar biosynthesis protein FlhF n=1 Tax=Neobacillus sp. LXY-1 TaxID=3379133 RepID=UPI003EE411FB